MKRKLLCVVCAILLLFSLLPGASGAQSMYFMAVNERILDFSLNTLPFVYEGTVYVPYTMFVSKHNGGVNLGVFYDWNRQNNILSLYSQTQPVLTFDIGAGTAYDTMDNTYNFRAIMRNSTIYLPAWGVCSYFGLQYSYLTTQYGTLIRIKKDGSYYLDDRTFVDTAADKLKEQKKQFDRTQQPEVTPTPTPAPTPSNTPPPVGTDRQVKVSFAFRCDQGEGPEAILDTLDGYGLKSIFFFRPEDAARWDDQIRRLLGEGHKIGWIVDGEDAAVCAAQAAEGNRLLSHIAHTRTDFLLPEGEEKLRVQLEQDGWVCWRGNINADPKQEERPASLALTLRLNLEVKVSLGRILLNDSAVSVGALERLLPQIIGDKEYQFLNISESDMG